MHAIHYCTVLAACHYIMCMHDCILAAIDAADDEPNPEVYWTYQTDYEVQQMVWPVLPEWEERGWMQV